ncbi:MAG: hypothetical protein RI956_957, partial [Pseudomonadota bacterium]
GNVQSNLSKNDLLNIKIPLPPLDIQEKIVKECEAIDTAVESAKTEIGKAKAEIEGVVLGISQSNYPIKRLGEIIKKINENIDPKNESGEVNYIGLENIESQTGTLIGSIKAQYSKIKSSKTQFQENDVLYGKLRPNLNKVYLSNINGICSTDILVFRFSNKVTAKYCSCYFLTANFNEEVLNTVSGQQLPRTSWTDMQEIKIPLPSIEIQETIVAEIKVLEQIINENQTIINAANSQKQAIIQSYL